MPNLNEYPTCDGAVASASRYNVKTYNAACYRTSQYFEFDTGSGSLSGSQFTKSGSYYIYNGSSITLPTPTPPSGYEFKKWSSNKGEATAGTTITLDANETKRGFQAIYAKKATAESITKNLVLNLNETKELNSYFSFHIDSSKNVNISSSEPDKVAVSKGSSSYYVNGKAKTSNPVTVSMEFYDNTGDWISAIINVTVIEDSDDAYVPPTETLPENPAEHYIDDGSEQPTNPEIGGLTTTSMSACEKGYTVYYALLGLNIIIDFLAYSILLTLRHNSSVFPANMHPAITSINPPRKLISIISLFKIKLFLLLILYFILVI